MKAASSRRKSNLYYHPTWFIGKVIEFREEGNHQMLVESVERKQLGPHFVGRLVLHGSVTPMTVSASIRNTDWWLSERRKRRTSTSRS